MSLPASSSVLCRLLLPSVPPPAQARLAAAEPALEALLRARWPALVEAWPGVALAPADFWPYVGARVPETAESVAAVAALRLEELYLACACLGGDEAALAHIEARYFPIVDRALQQMRLGPARVDEIKQRLRQRLFTPNGARAPKIAAYAGRGDLGGWLRVIASRAALKLLREERDHLGEDDRPLERMAGDAEAELRYFKVHYRPLFRAAFASATAALPPNDKALLREYYAEGRTLAEIAARRDAHRVTVARWLDEIRHRLLEQTRHGLMERVRVSQHECDSIMRLVQSQIDLTFHRLLGSGTRR